MSKTKEIKLKPCPFCGGNAIFRGTAYLGNIPTAFYIVCEGCGMQTASNCEPKTKQAKDWNRRI